VVALATTGVIVVASLGRSVRLGSVATVDLYRTRSQTSVPLRDQKTAKPRN
jgi:hypothetical protein